MTQPGAKNWWHPALHKLYESLIANDPVQPVDLIFVLAGRMERKQYAIELFRAGVAPRLLLSVGRFEVSRMHKLDFGDAESMKTLRDRLAPEERHFFMTAAASGIRFEKVRLRRWSTYGEALGLREFLQREFLDRELPENQPALRVGVVSTDVHLRRIARTFAAVFRDLRIEFRYYPVPTRFGFLGRDGWWTRPDDRRYVLKELVKLAGYRVILATPAWARRRLMRLKD